MRLDAPTFGGLGSQHKPVQEATRFWLSVLGPNLGPTSVAFSPALARKLRQINEDVDGYEPEGRGFESLRASHIPL